MKKIKDEHLHGMSSMSELKAMEQHIDRQQAFLKRRLRGNLSNAREMFSLSSMVQTAFSVFDNLQSTFRYVRKGNYK